MNLKLQIITLLFSFFFGALFSFLLTIQYRFLYARVKWFQYLFTILFVFVMTLFYFVVLRKINYGIIHPYSILSILVGYCTEHLTHNYFKNHKLIAIVKKR